MSTTVNDVLPSTVPELVESGENWAIFQLRFRTAIRGKGLWGHFDGSKVKPVSQLPSVTVSPPSISSPGATSTTSTASATTTVTPSSTPIPTILLGTPGEILEWERNENIARSLLVQRLPNTTLIVVDDQPTVALMWAAVVKEYTYKGAFSQTRLHREFLSSRCPKGGNIRHFLNDLRACRAELVAIGIHINDDDYRSTIIQSLPWSLSNYASAQLSAAKLHSSLNFTIEPDMLIIMISDEWERTHSISKGRTREEGPSDDAMIVETGGKWKGKGKGKTKEKGPCYSCGGAHWKRECPERKKGGEKSAPAKPTAAKPIGGAHAVLDEEDVSFAVEIAEIDEDQEAKISVHADVVDMLEDWFGEEDEEIEEEGVECAYMSDSDDEEVAGQVQEQHTSGTRIEIFDSGSSRHISPYRDAFSVFEPTPPRSLRAANQQSFNAVGKGEIILDLPNGITTSQLRLTEVLYLPEAGYTLVSIGRLDEAGFTTIFSNGKCIIRDPGGTRVAEIPRNDRGLYKLI